MREQQRQCKHDWFILWADTTCYARRFRCQRCGVYGYQHHPLTGNPIRVYKTGFNRPVVQTVEFRDDDCDGVDMDTDEWLAQLAQGD